MKKKWTATQQINKQSKKSCQSHNFFFFKKKKNQSNESQIQKSNQKKTLSSRLLQFTSFQLQTTHFDVFFGIWPFHVHPNSFFFRWIFFFDFFNWTEQIRRKGRDIFKAPLFLRTQWKNHHIPHHTIFNVNFLMMKFISLINLFYYSKI